MANVTDIEDIVKTWAWTTFVKSKSKDKLKFEDARMEVNWSRVRFVAAKPEFSDQQMVNLPKSQVVFKSTFMNSTDHEQEHSFQTERTTSCVSTTSMTKGFTKGFNLELKLALPEEVAEVTAGFGREVNMENTEEDTHEESLTWAVDSTIKVPPKHKTTAEMVVREQEFNSSYKMNVTIKGIVIVSVLNLKDNNSLVSTIEGDFSQVMSDEAKRGRQGFTVDGRSVRWEIEGTCKFRFGVEQQIRLNEESIES